MENAWNCLNFFDAVTEFTPPAIAKLQQIFGEPHFGYPRYALRGWRRGMRDPEDIHERKLDPVWVEQYGSLAWKRSNEITQLPEFERLLEVVQSDESLRRRLFASYGAVLTTYDRTAQYLYPIVQNEILEPLVLSAKAFQCSEDQILGLCRSLEGKISSVSVTSKCTVMLGGFLIEEDLRLDDQTVVRRMSDDELSDAIEFDVIMRRHVARNAIY